MLNPFLLYLIAFLIAALVMTVVALVLSLTAWRKEQEKPELLIVLKKKECEMVCRCIEFAEYHGIADFEEMQLAHNLRQRHGFERKFHA